MHTTSTRRIRVLPSATAVATESAKAVIDAAARCIEDAGAFTLALAGGKTPEDLYRILSDPANVTRVDWSKVEIYFGDERCVPPSDPQSNFRMADEAMLDSLPIPPGNIHRMRGEMDPETAAREYGQMLKQRFGDGGLDMVILGMGGDGHTASLFPHTPALTETEHRCIAQYVDHVKSWRITLTPIFLNRSKEILVLVTGAAKAQRVQEVLEGEPDPERFPIQLIDPAHGQITWLLDADAAGMA